MDGPRQPTLIVPLILSFTPLTAEPYTTDLFLNRGIASLQEVGFPSDAIWNPSARTVSIRFNPILPLQSQNYTLFRKFHFSNSLTDTLSGSEIGGTTRRLIVLIHGWNPTSADNQYAGPAFSSLQTALESRLRGTSWQLSLYRWEKDSDTGPSISIKNPTESAANGHQHGQHLGELLIAKAPNLEKVHFIVHSAGTWVARAAAKYLLQNSAAKIQVTLLDPFIPGELPTNTPFTKGVISAMPSLDASGSHRLVLLENYYANDEAVPQWLPPVDSDVIFQATSVEFGWGNAVGVEKRVDWGAVPDPVLGLPVPGLSLWYDAHHGPIQFYADTVNSADNYLSSGGLENEDFDLNAIGWKRSMFYHEQQIRPTIASVSPATLTALPPELTQRIVILGTKFRNDSKLRFTRLDDNVTYPDRSPQWISQTELRYDISVGLTPRSWRVKVVNEDVESNSSTFHVVSGEKQLTGLSISGPATLNENGNGQFTATAYYSDGSQQAVTATAIWTVDSGITTISSAGTLTAGAVNSDTTVTISARYTSGNITRTANANLIVLNTREGGTRTDELVVNGAFTDPVAQTEWERAFDFYADNRFTTAKSPGGYAYLSTSSGQAGNNLYGEIVQYVRIPDNTLTATLSYWYRITTQETGASAADSMLLQIQPDGGQTETLDTRSNADANLVYQQRTFDVTRFKGRRVMIGFAALTDSVRPTTFRIDEVSLQATVPLPVTLLSLVINGPSSVLEGNTAAYATIAVFSDGTTQTVPASSWHLHSSFGWISNVGELHTDQVVSDIQTSISASFTYHSVTMTATKDITILNRKADFSYLAISGPSSINENSSGQFAATAIFIDGSSELVSPTWSVNSPATSISAAGALTAAEVIGDTTVTISATYTIDGVTRNTDAEVIILNVTPPISLVSLSISGPDSVGENSVAQYTAIALFSDGSSQFVTPNWSVDPPSASISVFGLLTAGNVTGNAPVSISAVHTLAGTTRSASKSVTIVEIQRCSLHAAAGVFGSVDPVGGFSLNAGQDVTFTAYPSRGYVVQQWLLDGTFAQAGGTNFTIHNVRSNHGVLVTFTLKTPVEGPIVAWGFNYFGQATPPGGLREVIGIAAGGDHNLLIHADGTVTAWGSNGAGQTNVPAELHNVVGVSAKQSVSVALRSDGTVIGWGDNGEGQSNVPLLLTNVVEVAAAAHYVVALRSDGTLARWGNNAGGRLDIPAGLTNVVSVAAGTLFTLALKRDGTLSAWGYNDYGLVSSAARLSNVVAISAYNNNALALKSDGTVIAWGNNEWGQTNMPPGLSNVVAIAQGHIHGLALLRTGNVVAWGGNNEGQTNVPVTLTNAIAIAAGALHSLAIVGEVGRAEEPAMITQTWTDNRFSVMVLTEANQTYNLEYKNSFSEDFWTPLPLAPGTGGLQLLTDGAATNAKRFYRIRQH